MKDRIEKMLDRMVPPGLDWVAELKWLAGGLILCTVLSAILFISRCAAAVAALYEEVYRDGERVSELVEGRMMAPFSTVMQGAMAGFVFLWLVILALSVYHYLYYYQESKSIYLMRRLPGWFEIHRRSFALPAASIAASLLVVILLIPVYFGLYCLLTPGGHMEPGQWSEFWRSGAYLFGIWTGGGL